jgi:hypothetical protein
MPEACAQPGQYRGVRSQLVAKRLRGGGVEAEAFGGRELFAVER